MKHDPEWDADLGAVPRAIERFATYRPGPAAEEFAWWMGRRGVAPGYEDSHDENLHGTVGLEADGASCLRRWQGR